MLGNGRVEMVGQGYGAGRKQGGGGEGAKTDERLIRKQKGRT